MEALTRVAQVLRISPTGLLEEQAHSAQHQEIQLLTQTLEQRSDLLPPMLAIMEQLLGQAS